MLMMAMTAFGESHANVWTVDQSLSMCYLNYLTCRITVIVSQLEFVDKLILYPKFLLHLIDFNLLYIHEFLKLQS